MSATEIRSHLQRLEVERIEACAAGLGGCRPYMIDLVNEISHLRRAFVTSAVTEIAALRGDLSGRQSG